MRLGRWLLQALLYALFALCIGVFSRWPPYHPLPPGQALIKLSFSHHGKLLSRCRSRTPEELAKLPPNMRQAEDCQRGRSPVRVEIDIDGRPVYRHVAQASGLSSDGAATVYQRFELPAGTHRLAVRLNDDAQRADFTHQREEDVTLAQGKVLVVDFNAEKGGITLQ